MGYHLHQQRILSVYLAAISALKSPIVKLATKVNSDICFFSRFQQVFI